MKKIYNVPIKIQQGNYQMHKLQIWRQNYKLGLITNLINIYLNDYLIRWDELILKYAKTVRVDTLSFTQYQYKLKSYI